jgi:hypothetical protein
MSAPETTVDYALGLRERGKELLWEVTADTYYTGLAPADRIALMRGAILNGDQEALLTAVDSEHETTAEAAHELYALAQDAERVSARLHPADRTRVSDEHLLQFKELALSARERGDRAVIEALASLEE